jgi:hypothetical protein
MNEPRPFASLSPTLLARKGAARPAMRPQLQPLQQFHENAARQMSPHVDALDDLGWNDHGETPRPEAEIVPIGLAEPANDAQRASTELPEVVRQRAALPERLASERPSVRRRSALAEGRRAAFTLRLDAERHLKLRLACTISNKSAQQLVTDALDRLLEETPAVSDLASRVVKRS